MRKETSTNFINETTLTAFCNASKTLALIEGRWKLSVIFSLFENGEQSYSDFKQLLPQVSDRILSLQLKALVNSSLLLKEVSNGKSTYSLSETGSALKPVLNTMRDFAVAQNL